MNKVNCHFTLDFDTYQLFRSTYGRGNMSKALNEVINCMIAEKDPAAGQVITVIKMKERILNQVADLESRAKELEKTTKKLEKMEFGRLPSQ